MDLVIVWNVKNIFAHELQNMIAGKKLLSTCSNVAIVASFLQEKYAIKIQDSDCISMINH